MVEGGAKQARGALALAARRVPYVLFLDDNFRGHRGRPADRATWTAAAQAAAWVVVTSEQIGHEVAQVLSLRQTMLMSPGVDLEQLPLADQSEARVALGLSPAGTVLTWLGPLEADAHLDVLALTHRHLAGTTLLIAGSGSNDGMIAAMTLATRPSSPVIPIGPDTPAVSVTAGLAATVCITQTLDAAERLLALGRRVVCWPNDEIEALGGLVPGKQVVFVAQPNSDSLQAALQSALDADKNSPLSEEDVKAMRESLGQSGLGARIAQVMVDNLG